MFSDKSMGQQPSDRDLAIWDQVRQDLMEWQYTGLTGRLQTAGHRLLDTWTQPYAHRIVLEIGCGRGHHLLCSEDMYTRYFGLEIKHEFLRALQQHFPKTRVVNGDAYSLPFRHGSIDCVLSVYCFEHLRALPTCLTEIRRVMKPGGELLVGLPAEGGFLYGIGRRLTSKVYMERKYGIDYDAIVKWEHWNTYQEVVNILGMQFEIVERQFVPFRWLPSVHMNAIVCLRCRSKYRGGSTLNLSEVRPRPSSDDQNSRTRDPAASSDDDGKGPA